MYWRLDLRYARTRLDIKLKPTWRKSTSNRNRTEHVQCCNIEALDNTKSHLILYGQTEISYCVIHVDLTGILLLNAKTAGKTGCKEHGRI